MLDEAFLRFSQNVPSNGVIYDLGCGKGRLSLHLASLGFKVFAVDVDTSSLQFLKERAAILDLSSNLEVCCKDINKFNFPKNLQGKISGLVCTNVFNFFKKSRLLSLISKFKRETSVGGVHLISMLTKYGDLKSHRLCLLEHSELRSLYVDWEVIFYEEKYRLTKECDAVGRPKRHEVAVVVARKVL